MVPLAAAAFGLGHGAQGRVGIAVTGALGVALGALFVLTNSLLAVVVAHYVVNALELTVHEGLGIDRLVA
jgi:membrane protease YdiL (CAAX protease family)